jgi:hypothetical protein
MNALTLSIRQPWAWLIVNGHKDIENRNWHTQVRGPILVHAAKGMSRQEYEDCQLFVDMIVDNISLPDFADLERGGVVGRADLVNCVQSSRSPWFIGRYGFVLEAAGPLPFQACRGALGFFRPDLTGAA